MAGSGVEGDGAVAGGKELEELQSENGSAFQFQRKELTDVGQRHGISSCTGVVPRRSGGNEDMKFLLLKQLLSESEVAEILAVGSKVLSREISMGKARDADPADGRPAFATNLADRGVYREEVGHILRPLVDDVFVPFIRQKYAVKDASLATVRFHRLVPDERRYVPPHCEHDATVVVRINLQEPEAHSGGFFVQAPCSSESDRSFLRLCRGDACLYQSDLNCGLKVLEGSRFDLVLLFKEQAAAARGSLPAQVFIRAEKGDASAQYSAALSCFKREAFEEAQTYLAEAAGQDHVEALHLQAEWLWQPPTGVTLKVDVTQALQLWRRAAEHGFWRSQSRLGGLLTQSEKESKVQQDTWEGKRFLRLAVEQDDPDAAFYLGQCLLLEGNRDGLRLLLSACDRRHPRACFQLAEIYREGQYQFAKDMKKSIMYTKWAAHQGDAQALSNLGHIIMNGMDVVRDEAKAVRLFKHAAKLGAPEGELNYGLALLRGIGGVKVDYQEALAWAQKSAGKGHNLAHQQLPMFYTAARNPNPPARSLPRSRVELDRLSVKDLKDLLKAEGIDFSDCVEKADMQARAARHLLQDAEEVWDAAPECLLLIEPLNRTRADLLRQRKEKVAQEAAGGSEEATGEASNGSTKPAGHVEVEASAAAVVRESPATAANGVSTLPATFVCPADEEFELVD